MGKHKLYVMIPKLRILSYRLRRARLRSQHWLRRQWRDAWQWWRRNDRRYGIRWRLGNAAAAALILVAVVIPVAQQLYNSNSYKLSADALKLVGNTDKTLAKQLTYDQQSQTYEFNQAALTSAAPASSSSKAGPDPAAAMASLKNQVGTATGKGSDKSLYALDVPSDFSKGVTYHDTNTQLSFSLVPQFSASQAKEEQGHVIFPLNGGNQAIYTLKNNGLKEDIVVPKVSQDSLTFGYKLQLPKTLVAKVIPGSGGNIGIYSADPTLFGNISYGSSSDQAAVTKARENGAKTNLVFGLPSPVVKDTQGNQVGTARFQLDGTRLSVVASGLSAAKSAVTIDPSVVVTSTSDFQAAGNNDGNIDFSTSGQVTRGALTGGTIGSWVTNSDSGTKFSNQAYGFVMAYNGFLYVPDFNVQKMFYAPLNSNGSLGTWQNSAYTFNNGSLRRFGAVLEYNGYIYLYGGAITGATTPLADVQYAAISSSDGSVGPWTTSANSMATAACKFGYTAYNGYLYAVGGDYTIATSCSNSSTPTSTIQYAPILGNGDVGAWTMASTQFATARMSLNSFAYNGFIYVFEGTVTGSGGPTDIQYAPLAANGAPGAWVTNSTGIANADYFTAFTVSNGYLYYSVGSPAGGATANVYYAQIYANGAVGTGTLTTSLPAARNYTHFVVYNGYLYQSGGDEDSGGTVYNDTNYAKIDQPGTTTTYATSANSFTTTRFGGCTVAYNGKLYVIGGYNGTATNTVYYSTISANGNVGTWTATASIITARYAFGCTLYNGYVYVIGGLGTNGSTTYSDVQYSLVLSTGALNVWHYTHNSTDDGTTYVSGVLGSTMYGDGVVAYNGYLYKVGGSLNGTSSYNDVQYAPLNTNGTVGTWNYTHNSTNDGGTFVAGFYGTRYAMSTIVANGYVYIAGGNRGGSAVNDVQYAPLNTNGTVGTWNYTHNSTNDGGTFVAGFTTARYWSNLTVVNGYLYLLGGFDGTTYYNDVQYAQLNTNGTIGAWATLTSFGTTGRQAAMVANYNGYIYVLGGKNGSTYYNDVQYAAVNNGGNGATGSWTTNSDTGSVYPLSTSFAGLAYNGYFYILGSGMTANAKQVYYVPLNPNGSLGAWAATTSMNNYRTYANVAAYNGYLYAYSGYNVNTSTNTGNLEYAKINSDGSVGSWTTSPNAMASAVCRSSFASYNGYLYSFGGTTTPASGCGNTSGGNTSIVQYAKINSDGSVGTWATTTSFTYATGVYTSDGVLSPGATAYAGYLYIMGGTQDGSHSYSAVQYAKINSDGSVSSWTSATPMIVTNDRFATVAYNGYLYIVDEDSANAVAQYATINANGSIGAWTTGTTSLSTPRIRAAYAVYNGYVYVSGGSAVSNSNSINSTEYAPLSSISRAGRYSKLIDLGGSSNVTGITYRNAAGLSPFTTSLSFAVAGANGVFGPALTGNTVTGTGACIGSAAYSRYVFVTAVLDDSLGQDSSGGFADALTTPANLADFTVNYTPTHPTPNIRLRGGQTLQSGSLSALDTCQG